VAQVVLEVKLGVVDPLGSALGQGNEAKLLTKAGDQVQARSDVVAKFVIGGRLALEDRGRGHVHMRRTPLQVKKRGVKSAEAVAGHAEILSNREMCDRTHT
jgi:hypothetical protein